MAPPTLSPPTKSSGLARQRCAYHSTREAVARCPECRRFYCRECVTEHDDRLLCASCLKKAAIAEDAAKPSAALGYIRSAIGVAFGFGAAWIFFVIVLFTLAALPTNWDFSEAWKDKSTTKDVRPVDEVKEKGN